MNSSTQDSVQLNKKERVNAATSQGGTNARAITDNRSARPVQRKENNTGLPDQLKSGIENLSGMSMDNVKVHYNSGRPAQLNAHAYAQGTDIHVAPGQERHLPHEAWHVVQQAQGRVKPTMQMKQGVGVNDDRGLEQEADIMGARAVQLKQGMVLSLPGTGIPGLIQRVELFPPVAQRMETKNKLVAQLMGNVIQLEGESGVEKFKALCAKLWDLIKLAHTTKFAPMILNLLGLMTAAIRYARQDNSVGAQFGAGFLTLLTAIDASVTAVEEWKSATGEGKDLWKKRVDAIEKVTTMLILAASIFALPFNPTIGAAIGTIGAGAVKVLRGGYDFLAQNFLFGGGGGQQVSGGSQGGGYQSI
jgi:Domain of unknown function (DUF4157)